MQSTSVVEQARYIGSFSMLSIGLKKHCKENNARKKALYFMRKYYPTSLSIQGLFKFSHENMNPFFYHSSKLHCIIETPQFFC